MTNGANSSARSAASGARGSTRSPIRSTSGCAGSNSGQRGTLAPFGFPVVAKFTQYDIIVSESLRSSPVHGRFSASSVPKTYGTSPV
jgi:hypothetical protein